MLLREKDKKDRISDNENFWINKKLKSKSRKINLVSRKTLKTKSSKEEKKKIDLVKKAKLDAAIVRIMKSKKVAPFQVISSEVRKVLSDFFQMSDTMLRRMIEDLIKREFLERDMDNMNLFRYKS